ncbi:hypothetical protein [Aurantiacibacter sp. D1-12]|uniref:hypothetical protein n=1 Tax=Aurantiacibacter sp. D1-12 TaxID=2993658 RepID=UPI00237CE0C8|nr:hypothetical protein [Aurantiacibacter sp. D1-12]MDE1467973.1 hypothetical protein [Aurantiacibacter sp. D1-12]
MKAHILPLSQAGIFDVAKTEWNLVAVEISEEWDTCPCGQDIKEHCYIENKLTGSKTYVGNVCINRFIGIDTGTLFDGLKRISNDPEANPNIAVIEYAWERGFLFGEDEYRFLLSTARKRSLSERQASWKRKINRRILNQTVVKTRTKR